MSSTRLDRNLLESIIGDLKRTGGKIGQIEDRYQELSSVSDIQVILSGRVTAVDDTGAETTYSARVLSSANRTQSNWIINSIISTDPGVSFSVGDYVVVVLNSMGISYAVASGGASGNTVTEILPSGWSVAGS